MLNISIEERIPIKLSLKNPNRYLIKGWIFGVSRIKQISIFIDKEEFIAKSEQMEIYRPDVYSAYKDKKIYSLFSGFIVPVIINPVSNKQIHKVKLVALFNNNEKYEHDLGTITLEPYNKDEIDINIPEYIDKDNLLVICMATFNPDEKGFQRQINSIINQDFTNWICIINDDCSNNESKKMIQKFIAKDKRFNYFENDKNLGFYYNFERCLKLVPSYTKYVALCDQDDFWYPNKLSRCIEKLQGEIRLVFCDMKIVENDGKVISDTYWKNRKIYYKSKDIDLLSIANTVTGAASVFSAKLLNIALPFPVRYGDVFHDHWIAILAAATGGIDYINEPLYDYIQTGNNIIGHTDFGRIPFLKRLNKIINISEKYIDLKTKVNNCLISIIKGYEFMHINAEHIFTLIETALVRAIDDQYKKILRKPLYFFGLINIYIKGCKNKETLNNIELSLLFSKVINKFVKVIVIPLRRILLLLLKNKIKSLIQINNQASNNLIVDPSIKEYKRKFSGRSFIVVDRELRVNMLLSLIDPHNFFGGYVGMYNIAKKINECGYKVRILLTDQSEINKEDLYKIRNHDQSLKEFLTNVEFEPCYSSQQKVFISDRDIFVATSWWTAFIAQEATKKTKYNKFVYLSQDYEPIFYEHGGYRVLAKQSYSLNYIPLFSTDILQKYFLISGTITEENKGEYFKNPVLKFNLKSIHRKKQKKKLLFYARPQPHNARNLYPIGCLAIDKAAELGYFKENEWEVVAIGGDIAEQLLPSGLKVNHIGKFDMQTYKEILPEYDLGLALMDSPHPSLLPIEMASAGLLVVTNTYDNIKDDKYFKNISVNINAVEPKIELLTTALINMEKEVDNYDLRKKGRNVNWPHTWDEALPNYKIRNILEKIINNG